MFEWAPNSWLATWSGSFKNETNLFRDNEPRRLNSFERQTTNSKLYTSEHILSCLRVREQLLNGPLKYQAVFRSNYSLKEDYIPDQSINQSTKQSISKSNNIFIDQNIMNIFKINIRSISKCLYYVWMDWLFFSEQLNNHKKSCNVIN